LVLVSALASSSCTLHRPSGGGGGGGGGNNASVSLTISDSPSANTSVMSFTLPILGVTLTPSSGSAVSLFSPSAAANFELTRLQSDSALVATNASVPPGTYTSLKVTVAAASAVLFNGSSVAIGSCASGTVCSISGNAATITFSFTSPLNLTPNQNQLLDLDFNYNNAVVSTNTSINIDLTQPNVLSTLTAPLTGVPSGDFANVDDFTGQVTAISGSSITVKSTLRGSLTASINSSSIMVNDPQSQCTGGASFACVSKGSVVSLQGVLTSTGALDGTGLDVIDASTTPADEVEGTIYTNGSCSSGFGLIVGDSSIFTSGSPLASASFGSKLCLTLGPTATFTVDDGILTNQGVPITGFGSSGDLFAGQTIRANVASAISGTSGVTVTASELLLRFSRLTAPVNSISGSTFTVTSLPAYFAATPTTTPSVQTYINATLFEGVTTGVAGLSTGQTVSISALFLNPTTQPQPFQAAKVRAP